ncbi:hypothetical protein [Humisphaera borealis]|uniref:Uncharacterized protein n=1 Tax=Humisphaera borealis TaxID=2807512 RepID=A0A7M2WRC9_9BACT|nr:hypothetical protein [Humisphaera borealis]QOV87949.1 hypothetical protein IPV69_16965 [Humisphaera borealis]
MVPTLDYSSPREGRQRLIVPLLVSLVATPVLSIGAAVVGCNIGLGGWSLSPSDLDYSVMWGAVWGGIGGMQTAAFSLALQRTAVLASCVGAVIVSMLSGGSLLVYALASAAC